VVKHGYYRLFFRNILAVKVDYKAHLFTLLKIKVILLQKPVLVSGAPAISIDRFTPEIHRIACGCDVFAVKSKLIFQSMFK
jgi:hypothetical protein